MCYFYELSIFLNCEELIYKCLWIHFVKHNFRTVLLLVMSHAYIHVFTFISCVWDLHRIKFFYLAKKSFPGGDTISLSFYVHRILLLKYFRIGRGNKVKLYVLVKCIFKKYSVSLLHFLISIKLLKFMYKYRWSNSI